MYIERIESAFSRIPNGNFSSGPAGWGGVSLLTEGPYDQDDHPRYRLYSSWPFYATIPFHDLSVYPSVVDFESVRAEPASPDEVFVSAGDKYPSCSVKPFENSQAGVYILRGDPVFIDDTLLEAYSGPYLAVEVLKSGGSSFLKAHSKTPLPRVVSKEDIAASYYAKDPAQASQFWVKVYGDIRTTYPRPGGGYGVTAGDGFACLDPQCSGLIQSISYVGGETVMSITTAFPHIEPPSTGGATNWISIPGNWIIAPIFSGVLRRRLPVCLYDLTLAFTAKDGFWSALSNNGIVLKFYNEVGVETASVSPELIASPNRYLSKPIGSTGFTRIIMRFLFEVKEPYYGSARMVFAIPLSGQSKIAEVGLFRGNFTEQLEKFGNLSQRTFDYLEQPVARDSEIIPRGTIIAYVGGSVCPPGYQRAEGIGSLKASYDSDFIENAAMLSSKLATFSEVMITGRYGIRWRTEDTGQREPRTYLRFTVPSALRPEPKNIYPGCVLELRVTATIPLSVFAVVSGACLILPEDRLASPPDPPQYEIELVGDYVDFITAYKAYAGGAYVWKSGVVSYVQDAPDLTAGNHVEGATEDTAGLSYEGLPHEHVVKLSSDVEVLPDVGWPKNGTKSPGVLWNHKHLTVLSGASIPRVRPVLLCQKI